MTGIFASPSIGKVWLLGLLLVSWRQDVVAAFKEEKHFPAISLKDSDLIKQLHATDLDKINTYIGSQIKHLTDSKKVEAGGLQVTSSPDGSFQPFDYHTALKLAELSSVAQCQVGTLCIALSAQNEPMNTA
eukprot:scaffold173287_cov34-Prasinocladus_malaysianus.AAC.1